MSTKPFSNRAKRYFDVAKRNSQKSTFSRYSNRNKTVRIGAVIVKGNYIVAHGHNKNKSHTMQKYYNDKTDRETLPHIHNIHAEVDALIRSRYNDLDGCEIYVYRESVKGNLADCKPCKACMQALTDAGVKHVYFTSKDGFHYERIN